MRTALPTDFFVFLKNLLTNCGRGFIIFGVEGKGVFEPVGFKGGFSLFDRDSGPGPDNQI